MIWESYATISTDKQILHIRYFVLAPSPSNEVPCYGIGISDGENTHTVQNFCPDKTEAVRVATLLCRMQVTPTTFFEILDDYLATK